MYSAYHHSEGRRIGIHKFRCDAQMGREKNARSPSALDG